jgi:hypothetical protein
VRQPADSARSAWALTATLVATVFVAVAGIGLNGLGWSQLPLSDSVANIGDAASSIAYAVLGTLIVRRAANLTGWIMLAGGLATAFMAASSAYAIVGLKTDPGALPGAAAAGVLSKAAFVFVTTDLAAVLLVFPTGRLPSPRWRPAARAGLGLTSLTLAAFVVSPRLVALPAPNGTALKYPNPLAVRALGPAARLGTMNGLAVEFLLLLAPAVVALVLRYRRGDQRQRQQLKWLALIVVGVLICQAAGGLAIAFGQSGSALLTVASVAQPLLALVGIPVAVTIAILRYRLFDIDVIISRALLFTLLSAGVTAVYLAFVLGLGTLAGSGSHPALTIAAAVVIALVFQPLRQRASRLVNRLVYGVRATPYQVLSDFAAGMTSQLDLREALDQMVSLLAGASGASRVEAWVRVGAELRPAAVWPPAAGRPGPGRGAARAGKPEPGAGRPGGRPGRAVLAGRREHGLLLRAGGAAERGQACPGHAGGDPAGRGRGRPGVLDQRRRGGSPGHRLAGRVWPAGHDGPAGRARRDAGRAVPAGSGHHDQRAAPRGRGTGDPGGCRGPGPGGGLIRAASPRLPSRLSDFLAGEACVPRGRARVPACAGWRRAGGRRHASAGVPRAGRR